MDQAKQRIQKIVLVGFLAFAVTGAYIVSTLMSVLAATSGWFAMIYDSAAVRHGVPVGSGVILFIYFMSKSSVRRWGEEVVVEVGKVVWPNRKDTQALTIAVTFIILLAGLLLGGFDVVIRQIVNFVLNFQF